MRADAQCLHGCAPHPLHHRGLIVDFLDVRFPHVTADELVEMKRLAGINKSAWINTDLVVADAAVMARYKRRRGLGGRRAQAGVPLLQELICSGLFLRKDLQFGNLVEAYLLMVAGLEDDRRQHVSLEIIKAILEDFLHPNDVFRRKRRNHADPGAICAELLLLGDQSTDAPNSRLKSSLSTLILMKVGFMAIQADGHRVQELAHLFRHVRLDESAVG